MKPDENAEHWLVRAATIRWFWISGSLLLALMVMMQLFIKVKGYYGADGWFGFGAAFGFLSCVAMVLFAKALGRWLKRDEQFYDD